MRCLMSKGQAVSVSVGKERQSVKNERKKGEREKKSSALRNSLNPRLLSYLDSAT